MRNGILFLAALAAALSGNQLSNPDFTQWDNPNQPAGWYVEDSTKARIDQSTEQVFSPPYSCRFTRLVAGTGSNYGVNQVLPAVPGQEYTVAAWFFDDDTNCRAGLSITWCRADTTSLGNSGVNYTDSSVHGWQPVVKHDTAPDSTVYAKCLFRVYGFTNHPAGGIVYLDNAYFDVGLNPVYEAGPLRPPRELRVSPTLTAAGTKVSLALPDACRAAVTVRDLTGSTRATIYDGTLGPGRHALSWNGRDATGSAVPDGVYFVVVERPDRSPLVAKLLVQH